MALAFICGCDPANDADGGAGLDANTPNMGVDVGADQPDATDGMDAQLLDAGASETCAGVVCNAPPAPRCVGSSTLRQFLPAGTCASGTCSYAENDIACANGCMNGICVGEPCAGVLCNAPPAPRCVDSSTLRQFSPAGTCASGACSYAESDVVCANGCMDGTCVGEPCAGVLCNAPPAPRCVDSSTLRQFSPAGICASGTCSYEESDVACTNGCMNGMCIDDPCAGVVCNTPPAPHCIDSSTLREYDSAGECGSGTCSYAHSDTACPHGCAIDECASDLCAGIVCNSPPPPMCEMGAMRVANPNGFCGGGSCHYDAPLYICPNGPCEETGRCPGEECVSDTDCARLPTVSYCERAGSFETIDQRSYASCVLGACREVVSGLNMCGNRCVGRSSPEDLAGPEPSCGFTVDLVTAFVSCDTECSRHGGSCLEAREHVYLGDGGVSTVSRDCSSVLVDGQCDCREVD